jgi:hypothetical protein
MEGDIKHSQMFENELESVWAKARVELVLPHPTAHEAALRALFVKGQSRR